MMVMMVMLLVKRYDGDDGDVVGEKIPQDGSTQCCLPPPPPKLGQNQ